MTKAEQERAERNLNPTAPARVAMAIYSHQYAHEQRGGSMDFWDTLTDGQKRTCREIAEQVRAARMEEGTKKHG